MRVMKVADLVEALLKHDQDLPVFIRMWDDGGCRDAYLKIEPLRAGQCTVEGVSYDMPHIGGYYGNALLLGEVEE